MAHVAPNARARVPNFASGFSKNERAPFPAFVFSLAFETRVAPVADARSRTTNTQGQIESVTESKRSRSAEPVAGAGTSIHSEIERARADARDDALVIRSARSRRICARDDFDDRRVSAAFDLDSNSPDRSLSLSLRSAQVPRHVPRNACFASSSGDARRSWGRVEGGRSKTPASSSSASASAFASAFCLRRWRCFFSLDRDASLDARRVARSTGGPTGRSEGFRGN